MRWRQIGWYAFQVAVIGGVIWLYLGPINSDARQIGSEPVQPHIAALLGIAIALGLTAALNAFFSWIGRLRPRQHRHWR